jgi:hypothetical protein
MAHDSRCAGCGKLIDAGSDLVRIELGRQAEDQSFESKKEWGRMHRDCFKRSVASPELALEQIKAQAKGFKKQPRQVPA